MSRRIKRATESASNLTPAEGDRICALVLELLRRVADSQGTEYRKPDRVAAYLPPELSWGYRGTTNKNERRSA